MLILKILISAVIVVAAVGWFISQPAFRSPRPTTTVAAAGRLRNHVVALSQTFHPRDWRHVDNLNRCADYIAGQLTLSGATVESQPFTAQGLQYRNVIARFGHGKGHKLILGAHYDAFEGSPGADDNASGVAVLIETAMLLGREQPDREVEIVAYSLEEPPFFRTPFMGSAVHARSIATEKDAVTGVIVLEMVGCFRDDQGSQKYPVPLLQLFYPNRGNYLTVVGSLTQGAWIKSVKREMAAVTDLPVRSIRGPGIIPGIDFSDHVNYWSLGIPAVMITDTAFYRNMAYHTESDTAERLDYDRMAKVAVAVYEATRAAR